jgi:predicted  nucleic acid-binding Zn-ribbon protein
MAKKNFNKEAVQKQISDLELKIEKLQLQKRTLELALKAHSDKISE